MLMQQTNRHAHWVGFSSVNYTLRDGEKKENVTTLIESTRLSYHLTCNSKLKEGERVQVNI